ncbi:T9SS type A sorting domain-containing protein [bacterium]|nr:T9SS type A sorting domain-containing protein [bacterium]
MTRKCVLLALVLLLCAAAPAMGVPSFELLTWTTPGAAPAGGEPLSSSASFTMRSRVGGPFAGYAESGSFSLWGCSAYTPVECVFFASVAVDGAVIMRWSVESMSGIDGFNVYRSLAEEGPYERLNEQPLPPETPGVYEDDTAWPGTEFWYELRVVLTDGTEEPVLSGPASVVTGGSLVTRMRSVAPNPFTEQSVIQYEIASLAGGARLAIYDISGRVVRSFDVTPERPGRYEVVWNGRNEGGQRVASGVYFCAFEAGGKRDTRSIVLLR